MSELAATQELRPQFRLQSGRDDALIDWLASMQPRRRSDAIRDALRAYLRGQQRRVERVPREDPDLAAALDALF
ncbi:MAG: hypothetical protein JXA89_01400 [Anaerolineae bacterium]|nr:hypothetical protein [Anaerolineae bacterium]